MRDRRLPNGKELTPPVLVSIPSTTCKVCVNNILRVVETVTSPATRYCHVCDENVPQTGFVGHLRSNRHKKRCSVVHLGRGVVALPSAFKCRVASYRVSTENYHISVVEYMAELKDKIISLIQGQMTKLKSIKFNFELFGYFVLEAQDLQEIKTFMTANEVATRGVDLSDLYDNLTGVLDEKVSEFCQRESGV